MVERRRLKRRGRRDRRRSHWLSPPENWYRDVWLLVISGVVLWGTVTGQHTAHTASRLAQSATRLAMANRRLAVAIETERADNIYRACRDQNARHDLTARRLSGEIVFYEHHLPLGQTVGSLRRSLRQTLALVDALAPQQDCGVAVRRAFGGERHAPAPILRSVGLPPYPGP